jgi:hypothetical protein
MKTLERGQGVDTRGRSEKGPAGSVPNPAGSPYDPSRPLGDEEARERGRVRKALRCLEEWRARDGNQLKTLIARDGSTSVRLVQREEVIGDFASAADAGKALLKLDWRDW